MKVEELLCHGKEHVDVNFIGLVKKTARLHGASGSSIKDISGWDVITHGENNICYSYYVAQAPMIGISCPAPTACPIGIMPFEEVKIDIKEAINLFHTQNGGDKFTEINLCKPLTHPASEEPFWYFRTNLNNTVLIGANSGQVKGHPINIMLYMAQAK